MTDGQVKTPSEDELPKVQRSDIDEPDDGEETPEENLDD